MQLERMETETANISLRIAGRPLHVKLEVPKGSARRRDLLPVFRQVADAVVDSGVQEAELRGERVSCARGCGACCRQLVPISEPEAHALRDLIDALPAERRATVLARFATARRRLDEAGLLERLDGAPRLPAGRRRERDGELRALGLEYFRLGIACPFLDDEACSIHAQRPIACREYLVTSPAAHCAAPAPDTVRMVPLAGSAAHALRRTGEQDAGPAPWIALVLAPAWTRGRAEEQPRPARELVETFFRHLAAK
jgi:Fe-S-cluster containining protein